MTGAFRTKTGGRIDRQKSVSFQFDGKTYQGYEGDTLASALLANGVHLMGRSFKYHRPRGVLSAGSEEPNALVTVRRDGRRVTPNLRATEVALYQGLEAHSQNRWPSLNFDVGAINSLMARFIPSGFYYKTFMWPRKAWDALYEPIIRQAAGLGDAPTEPDPDVYLNTYAHCEILVVGGGPAGLAAALSASQGEGRVILVEDGAELGGSLLIERDALIDGQPALDWLASARQQLAARPNVTILTRATAFAYNAHNMVCVTERLSDHRADAQPGEARERLWQIRAGDVILAQGAVERPLVFPDNDRPGVLLAEAARTYLNRYGVTPGRRVVVATGHDSAYRVAIELQAAGVEIAALADLRPTPSGPWVERAQGLGIKVLKGTAITGTSGGRRVTGARLSPLIGMAQVGKPDWIACDAVLMSGGCTPSVHLWSQSRGKVKWDEALDAFLPSEAAERAICVGAGAGRFDLAEVLADGAQTGARLAGLKTPPAFHVEATPLAPRGVVGAVPHDRGPNALAFVDWQNDVTAKDLKLAVREGFQSIEHLKRYTTTGMATDQGKTSNLNALAIASDLLDRPIPAIGLTTFRMPFTPVTFGTLAGLARGDLFDPVRCTPMHGWAEAKGAVFEDVSLWKRARYFPQGGEDMHAAVARECLAVRSRAGIFDASTLGKIEIVGPDAAEFLNRFYINAWTKLGVGRCRYGVLLREDGFVMDDGVVGRLAADRFHLTTTTGGAARVLAMMEDYLQTEWPDLRVACTSTTEQWAVIAVQGPKARDIVSRVTSLDLSSERLPHMSLVEGEVAGAPARLFRVSFTGELGYEINVPSDRGLEVWEKVVAAGAEFGLTPYGTETMHVLRAEKGFIIVGQETDGTATPDDVGLGWAIGKAKPDFVGKRSLARPSMSDPDRKQLVGLLTERPETVLEEGAQIVASPGGTPPLALIGHVTSSYASATLGRSIALAMIQGGRARMGQKLYSPSPQGDIAVTVCAPVFYDPEGERVNG